MINYDEHPAFKFSREPLELKLELLNSFEAIYKFAESKGRLIPEILQLQIRKECFDSLEKIKVSLLQQNCTKREIYFLEELFKDISILLDSDIKHFFRKNVFRKQVDQLDQKSISNLLKLNDKLYFVSRIRPETVKKILYVSDNLLNEFRSNVQKNLTSREALSRNYGLVVKEVASLLNKDFEESGINKIISLYMGQTMYVGGLAIELSVPSANWWKITYEDLPKPARTAYFHFDESPAVPKAIVYLSDVTKDTGPTSVAEYDMKDSVSYVLQYLVGRIIGMVTRKNDNPFKDEYQHGNNPTFASKAFREDFMRLPASMRWNSHYGWDVIPDSSLENELLEAEKLVIGDAGTFVAFDGAKLLHRGGLLNKGERIALQVVFSPKLSLSKTIQTKIGRVKNKLFG